MKRTLMRIVLMLVLLGQVGPANALTINLDYLGGTLPTNSTGSGDLVTLMTYAAQICELTIRDTHTLTVHYGYTNVGGGETIVNVQGGTPNRITDVTIWVNNDNVSGHYSYWMDPTPWYTNGNYVEQGVNLGSGSVNATRCYNWPTVGPQIDLLTTLLHELGHALGLSASNSTFIDDSGDDDITIGSSLPFSDMVVPLQTNNYGVVAHIAYVSYRTLMSGSYAPGERMLPDELSLITIAQESGFTNLNLSLGSILEHSTPFIKKGVLYTTLSWIEPLGGDYIIQQCSDPSSGIWSTNSAPISMSKGVYRADVPLTGMAGFFRLKLKGS